MPPWKSYLLGPLFTHMFGCGSTISVVERNNVINLQSGASHVGHQIGFVYTLVQRGLEPSKMKVNIQE